MQYENRQPPEGINTSEENPLKEFGILLVGALAIIVVGFFTLGSLSGWLATKIPFEREVEITSGYEIPGFEKSEDTEFTAYLQTLVDRISAAQNLPPKMKIKVHYLKGKTINAFATLGGNIFLYKGILEKLPDENTLVTLISHEIAHVKYRHPIQGLGRGVALSIFMAGMTGRSNNGALGQAGLMTTLSYNRAMERQCDEEAMRTLVKMYGHLGGGDGLFRILTKERKSKQPPAIFSTHPLDRARIKAFRSFAHKNGYAIDGKRTPLKVNMH